MKELKHLFLGIIDVNKHILPDDISISRGLTWKKKS